MNNYTGMGFLPFTRFFCMEYDGLTQPCGYRNLWRAQGGGQAGDGRPDEAPDRGRAAEDGQGGRADPGWVVESRSPERLVLTREGEPVGRTPS